MKRMFKTLLLCVAMIPAVAMAQDKTANQYKNEGNDAFKAKNYQLALESYKQAIAMRGDSIDEKTMFAAATSAKNIGEYETAIQYYQKSIDFGYKAAACTFMIADIYGKQKNRDQRIATLEEGNAKNFDDAKYSALIKKELAKEYAKTSATIFNEGNDILNERTSAKQEQYAEIEARASEKHKVAKEWALKALELDPENVNAKKISESIK